MSTSGIRVRRAGASDRAFIVGLVPRLRDFGPPAMRPTSDLDRAEREALERAMDALPDDAALLLAELGGRPAGVALVETTVDYFTRERHAHLAIVAVAPEAEGRGVGRALLAAVDEWTRGRGYRFVTLNVFAGNEHARRVYERAGYRPDTIRYAKEL